MKKRFAVNAWVLLLTIVLLLAACGPATPPEDATVSYTHLDVYKRQEEEGAGDEWRVALCRFEFLTQFLIAPSTAARTIAFQATCTHAGGWTFIQPKMAKNDSQTRSRSCLLYTSRCV